MWCIGCQGPWVAERLAAIKPFFEAHAEDMHPVTRAITAGGARFSAVDAFEAQYSLLRKARVANVTWQHADVLLVPTSGTIYALAQVADNPVQLNSNLVRGWGMTTLCRVPEGCWRGGLGRHAGRRGFWAAGLCGPVKE